MSSEYATGTTCIHNSSVRKPQIISIEGNIGAGKTTVIHKIEKFLEETNNTRIRVLKEPVDIWSFIKDENNESILEKFYKDPKTYAFSFQILAFMTRLSEIKKMVQTYPDCEVILCERSLEADKNIFAKMMYDDGLIDLISHQIYLTMSENMRTDFPLSKVFYLDIPVETCADRIKIRNREGEENISVSYLEKCMKYHTDWLFGSDLNYEVVKCTDEKVIVDFIKTVCK
jgi:deoxyadenosine/deoxycytidine kinase